MAYLDGLTENITRTGQDGRIYYAPIGRFGPVHLVPDAASHAILKRSWRRFFIAFFAALVIGSLVVGPAWFAQGGWKLLLPAPIGGLIAVAYAFFLARRLPRAEISHAQLVQVSYSEAQQRVRAAMGPTTWRFVLGCSILMSVVGVAVAINTPTVTLWASAAFFVACSAILLRANRAR